MIDISGDEFNFVLQAKLLFQLKKGDFIRDLDISQPTSLRAWVLTNNNTLMSFELQKAKT